MFPEFPSQGEFGLGDNSACDWRATAAAWLVPIVLAGVFRAADAFAARHHAPTHECATAGAVIPRHDLNIPRTRRNRSI